MDYNNGVIVSCFYDKAKLQTIQKEKKVFISFIFT